MSAPKMTEREIQSAIARMAKQLGYLCFHTQYALGSAPGFPDLVIAGHGHVWFLEIKGPRGKVSDHQTAWIDTLNDAGMDAMIVWPDDLDSILTDLMAIWERRNAA